MKIEDAKRAEALLNHLQALWPIKTWMDRHGIGVKVTRICMDAIIPEAAVPAAVRAQAQGRPGNYYHEGCNYEWRDFKWTTSASIDAQRAKTDNHYRWRGCIETMGPLTLKEIKAALDNEIKQTEHSIQQLGFDLPEPTIKQRN
jgi:hypothetical protein